MFNIITWNWVNKGFEKFNEYFGYKPIIWHSDITKKNKSCLEMVPGLLIKLMG